MPVGAGTPAEPGTPDGIDWRPLAARLAADLAGAGATGDAGWGKAIAQTPRHVFVPRFWAMVGPDAPMRIVDGADPGQRGEWLAAIYSDQVLATQYRDDGRGDRSVTSSASQPFVVARMLGLLDIRAGHRVLEIGTGTGYNAALLCHRLGDQLVTTVDIDASLVAGAVARLGRCGYRPLAVAGDGAAGVAEAAPYDRIIATCAIAEVPPAWVAQLAPGGRIVAPFTFGGALAVLVKTTSDSVSGHLAADPAFFMPLRPTTPPSAAPPAGDGPGGEPVDAAAPAGTTDVDTIDIDPADLTGPDLYLWLSLRQPELRLGHTFSADGNTRTGLTVRHAGHRAAIAIGAPGAPVRVTQDAARLADRVEAEWRAWRASGGPHRSRFGITAYAGGQYAWLDDPAEGQRWPLPG